MTTFLQLLMSGWFCLGPRLRCSSMTNILSQCLHLSNSLSLLVPLWRSSQHGSMILFRLDLWVAQLLINGLCKDLMLLYTTLGCWKLVFNQLGIKYQQCLSQRAMFRFVSFKQLCFVQEFALTAWFENVVSVM